jgi:hypothetical protein
MLFLLEKVKVRWRQISSISNEKTFLKIINNSKESYNNNFRQRNLIKNQ